MFNNFKKKLIGAWHSFTVWFNGIAGAILLLLPVAQDSFPQLQSYIPDNLYKWGMGLIIVANIILRFKTVTDLANK